MTPHGVHAHLPYLDLANTGGWILADIFCTSVCYSDEAYSQSLYLLLEPDPGPGDHVTGRHPRYRCQWLNSFTLIAPGARSRLVATRNRIFTQFPNFVKWADIYISPRPRDRAHIKSAPPELLTHLSLGPSPPFRIKLHTISRLSHDNDVNLISVTHTPTPWTGHPPVKLAFRFQKYMVLVTLGICGLGDCAWAYRDPAPTNTSHYASVITYWLALAPNITDSELPRNDKTSHNCVKDHVSHGSACAVFPNAVDVFWMGFKRSLLDPDGKTLEVDMRVGVSKTIKVHMITK